MKTLENIDNLIIDLRDVWAYLQLKVNKPQMAEVIHRAIYLIEEHEGRRLSLEVINQIKAEARGLE